MKLTSSVKTRQQHLTAQKKIDLKEISLHKAALKLVAEARK
jgi:hypothetical protein